MEALSALLKHPDAVVQMRGVELLLKVAGDSPESRAMVERTGGFASIQVICKVFGGSGLLDVGMGPLLAFDDPLGCLACWDLFAELLSGASQNAEAGIIPVVSGWLQPKIGHVIRSLPGLDRTLQIGIMKLISSIVGQSTTSSPSWSCAESAVSFVSEGDDIGTSIFRQVTSSLMQRLTENEDDQEVEALQGVSFW